MNVNLLRRFRKRFIFGWVNGWWAITDIKTNTQHYTYYTERAIGWMIDEDLGTSARIKYLIRLEERNRVDEKK